MDFLQLICDIQDAVEHGATFATVDELVRKLESAAGKSLPRLVETLQNFQTLATKPRPKYFPSCS